MFLFLFICSCIHWHRLVKNIGAIQKYWGKGVAITDESIGVSQLLGAHGRAASPKSMPMVASMNFCIPVRRIKAPKSISCSQFRKELTSTKY